MSRCLPYARPIYKKEDTPLIGSIKKLQMQWGNSKQRKPVSSKVIEKLNKKRSREEHDILDSLQHKNKRRSAKNIKVNESCHDARKEDSDHLERSDLSEEQYPPALVLNQCNFSKGSQNISKKDAVQDSDSKKQRPGMVIRIKLPLKKHKDVEPESASTDPYSSSQATQSSIAHGFFTDSAPCSSSQIAKPSKVQAVSTESVPRNSSELIKLSKVQSVLLNQDTKSSNAQSALIESALRSKEIPSAKQPLASESAEPCFSGSVAEAPLLQAGFVEANPSESSYWKSSERSCAQRLEKQLFRDLIVNWKPPSFQPIEADEDELDWLFAPKKAKDAKPSAQICEAGKSDSNACPSSASSLQPRAIYLPEFDTYQMPYVIPF